MGKSTLFNRLTKTRHAIVSDEAGTTRDRQYGKCEWNGREFSVVDTGGWVVNSDDVFEEEIRRVREKGLTPQEIEEAKKWIVFREAVRRQEPGALVHEMARNEFFGGSFHEALRMVDLIGGLSVKEINSVIARYLSSPTSLVLSVVPPEKGKSGKKRGSSPGK